MPANIQVEVWRGGVRVIGPVTNTSVENLWKSDEVRLYCPDDNQTSYRWDLSYTPLGAHGDPVTDVSSAVLDTPDAQSCKFTVDWDGPYIVRLVINRGDPLTEDTKFIRARIGTLFGGVKLVGAGERRTTAPYVPVDASTVGWTNDMNTNMAKILAGVRRLSVSGRILYVDANRPLGYKNDQTTNPPNDPTKTVRFPGTDSTSVSTMQKTGVEMPTVGFGDFGTIQDAIDWAYGAGRAAPVKWARPTEEIASALNPFWIVIQPGLYEENLTLREHIHLSAGGSPQKSAVIPFMAFGSASLILRSTSVIIRPKVNVSHHGGHVFNAPRMPEFNPLAPMPAPVVTFLENCPVIQISGITMEVRDYCLDPMITVTGTAFLSFSDCSVLSTSTELLQGPLFKFLNPVQGTATSPNIQIDLLGWVSKDTFYGYSAVTGGSHADRCAVLLDSRVAVFHEGGSGMADAVEGGFIRAASDMYTAGPTNIGCKAAFSSLQFFNSIFGGTLLFEGLVESIYFDNCDTGGGVGPVFINSDVVLPAPLEFSPSIEFNGGSLWNKVQVNGDSLMAGYQWTISPRLVYGAREVFVFRGDLSRIYCGCDRLSTSTMGYIADYARPENGHEGSSSHPVLPVGQPWPVLPGGEISALRMQDVMDTVVRLTTPEDASASPATPPDNSGVTASWTPTLNANYAGIWGFDTTDKQRGLNPVQGRGVGRKINVVRDGGITGTDLPVQLRPHPNIADPLNVHLFRVGADATSSHVDLGFVMNGMNPALKVWGDVVADNISGGGSPGGVKIVAKSGAPYTTIPAAQAACVAGDVIVVYPGTYTETVTNLINSVVGIGMPVVGPISMGQTGMGMRYLVLDGITIASMDTVALTVTSNLFGELTVHNCRINASLNNAVPLPAVGVAPAMYIGLITSAKITIVDTVFNIISSNVGKSSGLVCVPNLENYLTLSGVTMNLQQGPVTQDVSCIECWTNMWATVRDCNFQITTNPLNLGAVCCIHHDGLRYMRVINVHVQVWTGSPHVLGGTCWVLDENTSVILEKNVTYNLDNGNFSLPVFHTGTGQIRIIPSEGSLV
jgi:hypothetical protein